MQWDWIMSKMENPALLGWDNELLCQSVPTR